MRTTCVFEHGRGLWHAFSPWLDWNDRWVPIMCGQGINLPGNPVEREPSCPACRDALARMIPGAPQLFPANGPKVETAGIEPAQCSRHGKPRLLDAFSGAGGCARGYQRAGFYVVGVDNRPQPRYAGDEFVQADALEFIREHGHAFDAIHASPPCQAFTAMRTMPNAREHLDLVEPTRSLILETGLPYVIENVPGAPLRNAVVLCGAALGLTTDTHDLARHRLFECSFPLMVPPCAHGSRPVIGFYGDHVRDARRLPGEKDRRLPDVAVGTADKLAWVKRAMGIDWMTWPEATQAIPPAYTEHVGGYLLADVQRRSLERAA